MVSVDQTHSAVDIADGGRSHSPPLTHRLPHFLRELLMLAIALACSGYHSILSAQERNDAPLYTDFFDRDLAAFEATLDLRVDDEGDPRQILTRAIILPLDHDCFVVFDTEMLRVAAVWRGGYPSLRGLAMHSYSHPLTKSRGGFGDVSKPVGNIWYRAGVRSDWFDPQNDPPIDDPRTLWTDPAEPGRGPLIRDEWGWSGIDFDQTQTTLSYQIAGVTVREQFEARISAGQLEVQRRIHTTEPLNTLAFRQNSLRGIPGKSGLQVVYRETGNHALAELADPADQSAEEPAQRWPDEIATQTMPGEPRSGFAVDDVPLPYPNPWQRRIRPVDIAFDENGVALIVTYDGDVYRWEDVSEDDEVSWRRVAAGFNEPMGIAHNQGDWFVLSRGGITRLVDRNGDGEFDRHELFSNRFVQSPDTRDFAFSLVAMPDGGFLVSKGGQQVDSRNPHGGRILQISPDGKTVTVLAAGFRNTFVARDPISGVITASDQQGNWVPATPFHIIEPDRFYGYEPSRPTSNPPVSPPRLWFPHVASPSSVGMVMGFDERFSSLQGKALVLDYNRPLAMVADITEPASAQTSALQLPTDFEIPLLNGEVNPADGQVYLVGFQIWDSAAPRLEGISRLRQVKPETSLFPTVTPFQQGILIRGASADVTHYEVRAWNYFRSAKYGSPQFNRAGDPGFDQHLVATVVQSEDAQDHFLVIPDFSPAMSVVITEQNVEDGRTLFLSVHQLETFTESDFGFATFDWDAKQQMVDGTMSVAALPAAVISADRGEQLATQYGCIGCHSPTSIAEGRSGPAWGGLFGSTRNLEGGTTAVVDEAYLRESILNPTAKVPVGYDDPDAGMPPYLGVLGEPDVESLVLYIKSLP